MLLLSVFAGISAVRVACDGFHYYHRDPEMFSLCLQQFGICLAALLVPWAMYGFLLLLGSKRKWLFGLVLVVGSAASVYLAIWVYAISYMTFL